MDIEDKLDVVQKLRREQKIHEKEWEHYNRGIIFRNVSSLEDTNDTISSSLFLRSCAAFFLFFCFFILKQKGISVGEWNASAITSYIETNMDLASLLQLF